MKRKEDIFMKIMYISNTDDKYGAPRSMIELIINLKENYGIEPIVLTSKKNNINRICDQQGIENYVTYHRNYMISKCESKLKNITKRIIRGTQYIIGNFLSNYIIKKKIDMSGIDIIHTNTTIIDLGQKLSKKYNITHVQHLREFGDVDYSYVPIFRKNYINDMNNNVNFFIAISNAVKECWIKKGIDKNKIKVIYNGINESTIKYKENYNDTKLNIIFTGNITKTKGQYQLIEALHKLDKKYLKQINVDFYGDGKKEYLQNIKNLVHLYELEDNIKFKGFSNEIPNLLHKYNVGIVCSKSEGFGRVTVEYMIAGLCVIASNTGANIELIKHRKNGYLYNYNQYESLNEYLIEICNNRKQIELIGKEARKDALGKYVSSINVENVHGLYKIAKEERS